MVKQYFVYILSSKARGTLYIGVANDFLKRIWEHKNKLVEGFTKKYDVHDLVYYEITTDIREAIAREKQMKKWNRDWKIQLIESQNPKWEDLYNSLVNGSPLSRG